jgi:hypothetical protein
MKRRKPGRPEKTLKQSVSVGYAWYKEDQWDRLHQVCPDSKDFPNEYREWLSFAEPRFEQLTREGKAQGMKLVKVTVDVDELLEWCQRHRLQPNGHARSQFVAEKVATGKG